MVATSLHSGLTTSEAPFIDDARAHGQIFIEQPYELYSEENHQAWAKLFSRMGPRWQRYANPRFLDGISSLCLDPKSP
jgi:phenylalanine-4-hydroxylase